MWKWRYIFFEIVSFIISACTWERKSCFSGQGDGDEVTRTKPEGEIAAVLDFQETLCYCTFPRWLKSSNKDKMNERVY